MSYSVYNKPYRTYTDLVRHLQGKNLTINDVGNAELILKRINYYRFKIYLRPFLDEATDMYRAGTEFENGLELYRFDDELRDLVFSAVGRIEVKLRSRLDQAISEHSGQPFWYLDDANFNNSYSMESIAKKISNDFQHSRDDFTNNFKSKYVNDVNDNFKGLPPFWIAAELTSFGTILKLYKAINKSQFVDNPRPNKLDALANEFGARNLGTLNSWLTGMRDIRNRCAHHSRLWNCNYREPARIRVMIDSRYTPPNPNRIYLLLVMLNVMCGSVDIQANLKNNLQGLFAKYPAVAPFLGSIGFHPNWHNDPIWA